jgi:hypothetical protein
MTDNFGAAEGNRILLHLLDRERRSQRATTAYWYHVRVTIPSSQRERLMTSPEVERGIFGGMDGSRTRLNFLDREVPDR